MDIFKIGYTNPAVVTIIRRTNNTNSSYIYVESNVRLIYEAGVPNLAGIDAVGLIMTGLDVPFGLTLHWELDNLVSAGLTQQKH